MNGVSSLLLKLNMAIENLGITVVMGKLDEINESSKPSTDKELSHFIISECCKKYNISKDEMTKNSFVRGEALVCRNMCFVLMNRHIQSYTHLDIANSLNRKARTVVGIAINDFLQMEDKVKYERDFKQNYKELNDIVNTHKNQLFLLKIA